ncbi:MAG TPA: ATP-binding protein [Kofleriaceae bacterium]
MARSSIRRRFLVGSLVSTVLALVLFAIGSTVVVAIDDTAEQEIRAGGPYDREVFEIILGAMAIAAPIAVAAAFGLGVLLARRSARPVEDAIRAARETSAHDLERRLPVPTQDDELRDLTVALNDLFARLADGFSALERFAADASHELRTPVAVVATELEVALRHPRTTTEWEATARNSLEELRRISQLVEGLLTLARAGADAPAARSRVTLVECADNVISQLGERAEQAAVAVEGPRDASSVAVVGNGTMIETAIRNLLENAIAAVPRGGRVRISIDDSSAASTLIVEDNGPGLGADPETLFVPFRRDTDRAAGNKRGVGLGLAIARRVANAHGGALTAGVSSLGGAKFELRVPREA